jgi:RNA polymerase sigma-70 factor (ECF subfamily)
MKPTSGDKPSGAFDYNAAIMACAGGDNAALKALYDIEAPKMLGVATRLLKRPSLAEDAVHDAFVNIWTKSASFNAALGEGRAWMYAILRNRSLNMLRGEDRIDFTDDLESFGLASEEDTPEDAISRLSDASALRRCLESLDPPKRNAIVMAYMHGLSHGELAGKLNVPLGTMKSWIRRGLLALKECLG